MKLWPRTLLWRTFLLIATLMLISGLGWFAIYRAYEREPRARQMTQLIASVVNLTRSALINAEPERRRDLLLDLSDREGIHIYPVEEQETIAALPDRPIFELVAAQLRTKLGPHTRMTLERDGEKALFVSFRIDEAEGSEYWVALPRERIEHVIPWEWLGWGFAVLLLSLAGAYLIMFRITRPLKALAAAATDIGQGQTPAPVATNGPTEIATLAHAFNQMSADLAHLDSDRALILAGISHDLRTPLTRLRMNLELLGIDEQNLEGMVADIEEMNQTIGQFLDFARETSGEALQTTNLRDLLSDITAQYARRNIHLELILPTNTTENLNVPIRPQGLRRAIANLLDNALRYAGHTESTEPLQLSLRQDAHTLIIAISDRGPGIPEAEIERIKQPFTRLEAARSNISGAGLGLAIVERIARSHDGSLQLHNRAGGGLVAEIRLPVIPEVKLQKQ